MNNCKIYLKTRGSIKFIYIEIDTSKKSIKKKIDKLMDVCVLMYDDVCDTYCAELTEKHIVKIVDCFGSYKHIDIADQIRQFYDTIMSWDKKDVRSQFDITDEIISMIQEEIGDIEISPHILADRSIRYQYNKIPTDGNSLIDIIANRESVNVWADNNVYSLVDLVNALMDLQRLPILITYDVRHQSLNFFDEMVDALGADVVDKILISSQTVVDPSDKIVIVSKFTARMLNTEWVPKSVISYNSSLRNCKTAIYANRCDLRISYTAAKPLIKTKTY